MLRKTFFTLFALMLCLSFFLWTGCQAEEEEASVEIAWEGSGNFDHEFEVPSMAMAPDYLEDTSGLDYHVLVSTGPIIATLTPDGEFLNKIEDDIYADFPTLSPDGSQFVAIGDPGSWDVPWHYVYHGDMRTGEVKMVDFAPESVRYEHAPTWAHDGNTAYITGLVDVDEWIANVYYFDFSAGESGVLLDHSEIGFWHIEGIDMHPTENILYMIGWEEDADMYGVYAYDLDADTYEEITLIDEEYVYDVTVSPDNSMLAVAAGEEISEDDIETFGLYLVDLNTGEQDLVFWGDGLQSVYSEFSPDGSTLLICTDTRVIENTWSIYAYNLDTNRGEVWTRARYDTGYEPFSPSWGPIAK